VRAAGVLAKGRMRSAGRMFDMPAVHDVCLYRHPGRHVCRPLTAEAGGRSQSGCNGLCGGQCSTQLFVAVVWFAAVTTAWRVFSSLLEERATVLKVDTNVLNKQ
jgi:hypothetical protein